MTIPAEQVDYRKYLDPRTLAKIQALDIRARLIVEGFITGMHRSPYKGFSVEFSQHRQYVQGDDIRYIDWKVFGRTDRHYIKQYEEETNLQVMLVVDASESMTYAGAATKKWKENGDGWRKFDHATSIAASLAYVALHQQDSAGLAVFDQKVRRFIKPSNNPRQWRVIVDELTTIAKNQKTQTGTILDEIAEQLHHRSLIVLISDLFDDPRNIVKGIQHLRYRRHDLIVLQILDHDELEFPFESTTLFKGMEEMGELVVEPRALRETYIDELRKHSQILRDECHKLHVDYVQVDTSMPLDVTLPGFLATRAARMK
ncbi:MAG: DUF58 domain-containing protein [Phycisphaerales bacterium]|nr:DUF58 domain-containing protein [Phycisphaerales bacterium]